MQCPNCSGRMIKNGSGRTICVSCRKTGRVNPDSLPAPEGFAAKGSTTLYGPDGDVRLQWVRADLDKQAERDKLQAFAAELAESVRGLAKPVPAPAPGRDDVLSVYPIGDAHFGMYAWAAECGEDFDTDIAARDLASAVVSLVRSAPKAKYGLLVDVGDSLHIDNRSNTTPRSGNQMDVDTRYSKVARMLAMAFRHAIAQMLRRHEHVKVIIAPGNHNLDSAGWVAMVLDMFYESEPRVTIETTPAYFMYHRFGANLIGVTHGDTVKLDALPSIMATDRAQDWGETQHRIWLTGHIHHRKQQEYRGCLVEAFNTLAAKDAWHSQQGYRSARNMHRMDFHARHGLFGRSIVDVSMFREAA